MNSYRQQSSQIKSYKSRSVCIFILCLLLFIGAFDIHPTQCYASIGVTIDVSFSLDVERLPLKKACEIILKETDYKIIFEPKWHNTVITLKLDNVTLSDGIKRIIKITGITNYALVQNSNEIRILSFDINTDKKNSPKELNADSMLDTSSSTDAGISLTLADMQVLKKNSEEDLNNIPQNRIVTPPSSSGEGLTLEELEALKQANKERMENIPKNTVTTPPSSSGEGLTLGEFEALKRTNKQNMESISKDMIVTPPSASGKGLTIEELEALQNASK